MSYMGMLNDFLESIGDRAGGCPDELLVAVG